MYFLTDSFNIVFANKNSSSNGLHNISIKLHKQELQNITAYELDMTNFKHRLPCGYNVRKTRYKYRTLYKLYETYVSRCTFTNVINVHCDVRYLNGVSRALLNVLNIKIMFMYMLEPL
jgi:hypothetical protein